MKTIIAAGVALTCWVAAGAGAQGLEGNREGLRANPQHLMEIEGRILHWLANDPKAAQELLLTEEQAQALKTNLFAVAKERIDLKAQMEHAAENQAELLSSEEVNEAAVMKAVEETGRMRTEIAKANVRTLLAVHKILTPEQRKKLKEIIHQRVDAWRANRDKRMGAAGSLSAAPSTNPPHPPVPPVRAE